MNVVGFKSLKFESKAMDCPIHGQVDFRRVLDASGKVVRDFICPLCEEESERREEDKARQARLDVATTERYKAMNIRKEYWGKTLGDYQATSPMQKRYLAVVKRMIDVRRGKIIALGSNGIGKTMLAVEALKKMGGHICTMYEMSLKLRTADNMQSFIDKLIDAPLLVIDEIGRSKGSEFERNTLSYILDRRHSDDSPFIILGNVHFRDRCESGGCERCFESFFDDDLTSRFAQNCARITFEKGISDWRVSHSRGEK